MKIDHVQVSDEAKRALLLETLASPLSDRRSGRYHQMCERYLFDLGGSMDALVDAILAPRAVSCCHAIHEEGSKLGQIEMVFKGLEGR